MLTYRFIAQLFPTTSGIVDETIEFHSLFVNPFQKVTKGLFVPLLYEYEELKYAIEHGAIAAIWPNNVAVPKYVPNHFPIFFVDSPVNALKEITLSYLQSYRRENNNMTRFYLDAENVHNNRTISYDKAAIDTLKELEGYLASSYNVERGEKSC